MTFKTQDFKEVWIEQGFDDKTIDYVEAFGKHLVEQKLTTSQIRIIYGEVKRIRLNGGLRRENRRNKQAFLLLRPKIAYAAARAGYRGIEDLRFVLERAHKAVRNDADAFENFCDFFEATLAYHKAFGGRDGNRS